MQLLLKTWNGLNINDGVSFNAWIPDGQLMNLSADGITVPRSLDFPFLSTSVLPAHVFVLGVSVASGANLNTKRELLKSYFNVMDTTRHNLVAWDELDGNRPWYLTGLPIRVVEVEKNEFSVTLAIEAPVWKLVTAETDNWSITATAQTRNITNLGNIAVKPKFDVTPTTAKTGGLRFRRWFPIYNTMERSYVAPYDITNGGFNTSILVGASKMQADGDDCLVMVDGIFVDRWLRDMNTSGTQIFINLMLSPKREATTSVTIASSGAVSTISFVKTRASLTFLMALAKAINKVVLIDSEAFTFTGVNLVTYQLTGCTRAQKDTSMAAHTAPATARWIEHDIWLLYGDSTLSAPDVDDDNKPMFDITQSFNDVLVYTQYYDNTADRPMAWKPEVNATRTGLSYTFTGEMNTFVNPATDMGMAAVGSQTEYTILTEVAQVDWLLTHPSGVYRVKYSGKKYYAGTSWPEIVGLQYLQEDAAKWLTQENEAIPVTPLTWEPFGQRDETLPDTFRSVRFAVDGSLRPAQSELAMVQFESVTVLITFANLPVAGTVGPETSINWLAFTLTNNTSGEYLKVEYPVKTNDTLTVDCENKKAYTNDGSRVPVVLSTDREAWLDLRSGTNQLQYDDVGTGNVTLVTTHRDRNL